MKKFLLLLGLVVACGVNAQTINQLDPTQVYNTGNLVNNTSSPTNTTGTWQNIGLFNQGLPCWGPGGPVYCGPQPYFNDGLFNFSYGLTDVYQVVSIANALPNSGTGLRVNGFNFGFMAKNGNGWDDGSVDRLSAYVSFYDKNYNLATNYYYDLNYKFDWTQFNFSKNFDSPYLAKDLSTVRYGFIGGDNNFWAGPYGPEVYNISFSLKYSVDPCYTNPLSSPTCPGFADALAKIPTAGSTETTPQQTQVTNSEPITPTPTTTSTANNQTTVQTVLPIVQTSPSTTQTTNNQTSSSSSISTALSVIRSNARREQQNISNAVTGANDVAQSAVQSTEQTAMSVSTTSSSNSVQQVISTTNTTTQQQGTTQNFNIANISQSNTIQNNLGNNSGFGLLTPSEVANVNYSLPITQTYVLRQPNTSDVKNNESESVNSTVNFFTNRSNPLTEIVENNTKSNESTIEQKDRPMNKNSQNNELAMGVDINRMATAPIGYGNYLQLAIRDASFYAPKEIYRNQKVIDNQRAVRLLNYASELKHQEMVEQQYRR